MYKLDETVGVQIKDAITSGYNASRKVYFPGNSLYILIVQLLVVALLTGLLFKLFGAKRGPVPPEYY